jgi:hypothetical protein
MPQFTPAPAGGEGRRRSSRRRRQVLISEEVCQPGAFPPAPAPLAPITPRLIPFFLKEISLFFLKRYQFLTIFCVLSCSFEVANIATHARDPEVVFPLGWLFTAEIVFYRSAGGAARLAGQKHNELTIIFQKMTTIF